MGLYLHGIVDTDDVFDLSAPSPMPKTTIGFILGVEYPPQRVNSVTEATGAQITYNHIQGT